MTDRGAKILGESVSTVWANCEGPHVGVDASLL